MSDPNSTQTPATETDDLSALAAFEERQSANMNAILDLASDFRRMANLGKTMEVEPSEFNSWAETIEKLFSPDPSLLEQMEKLMQGDGAGTSSPQSFAEKVFNASTQPSEDATAKLKKVLGG